MSLSYKMLYNVMLCNIKCFFIASLPLLLHLQEICQFQISDPNGAGLCPMEAFIWRWFLRGLIMIPSYPINDENNMKTMSNCMNISLTCLHCNSLYALAYQWHITYMYKNKIKLYKIMYTICIPHDPCDPHAPPGANLWQTWWELCYTLLTSIDILVDWNNMFMVVNSFFIFLWALINWCLVHICWKQHGIMTTYNLPLRVVVPSWTGRLRWNAWDPLRSTKDTPEPQSHDCRHCKANSV